MSKNIIKDIYCTFHGLAGEEASIKEEMYADIYNFGKVILEILTNGRIKDVTKSIQSKAIEDLLEEICSEQVYLRKEISLVLEVALLCTRSRPSEQPSMKDVLNRLSGLNC